MTETDATGDELQQDVALRVLLVEDNPGDARYIRELFQGAEELSERASLRGREPPADRPTSAAAGEIALVHENRLSAGLERLAGEPFDVVLLDLNLPDSDGLETVEALRRRVDTVPVVVLTGLRDRETGMEALRRGAEEYLVKDEVNAELLIRSVYHAIERKERERQLDRQRTQLATLNALNELVHEISHLVIESSTREEIERQVCERLAASALYRFAWIGEIDRDYETVTLRVEAGVEGYLDGFAIPVDAPEAERGPTERAVRTGEVHVAQHLPENPTVPERVREHAREYGFRSSAAIPIAYESTLYAVLNVYSARPDAFEDDERAVIGRLGQVVGHAINAVERKQALMSEEVVELRLQIEDVLEAVGVGATTEGTITFDRAVPGADDGFLEYGTVTADAVDTLRELVEHLPHFDSVELVDESRDPARFELRSTGPPAHATIASYGGYVESAVIADGDYRLVVHVPPSADVGRVVEAVQEDYPDAAVIAQRTTTRTGQSAARLESVLLGELTEKQRAALEAAYFAGFFEWPRNSSGEDIAESMGVSPPTFHQHARVAEQKLFRRLFDADRGDR